MEAISQTEGLIPSEELPSEGEKTFGRPHYFKPKYFSIFLLFCFCLRERAPKQTSQSFFKQIWDVITQITVEPSMFFYMMAFMLTSVVEQAFFMHKACRVDLNYSEEICENLSSVNYKNESANVQIVVSKFHQYNDIASHVIPIFLALFVGAWSDRRGRKLLLLLGLTGKLWYSIWIVINSLQDSWTLDKVILSASLPSGLTGADLSIFAAAFAYLSDITTLENRTKRITILDVTYLVSMPTGVALGKYLFACFGRSYAIMFSLNASLLFVALLYSFFRLKWATNFNQRPLTFCCSKRQFKNEDSRESEEKQPNFFLDFFDKAHLLNSVKTLFKKRQNHGRIYLIILIISMGLYTFQRDERQMSYLYTHEKFQWEVNAFSDFRTFQSGLYVLGTLLCVPLMGKYFKLSDTTMVIIGTSSHAIARVIFALAEKSWLFYLGATVASLGPVVAPVLRSMASKIVDVNERGKVFAILSVADTTVPLFSGAIYSQVYIASLHSSPSAIYWVTVSTQMAVFIVALIIRFTRDKQSLDVKGKNENAPLT